MLDRHFSINIDLHRSINIDRGCRRRAFELSPIAPIHEGLGAEEYLSPGIGIHLTAAQAHCEITLARELFADVGTN
jgi:hypothetical protein